jgi:hypothetical protein
VRGLALLLASLLFFSFASSFQRQENRSARNALPNARLTADTRTATVSPTEARQAPHAEHETDRKYDRRIERTSPVSRQPHPSACAEAADNHRRSTDHAQRKFCEQRSDKDEQNRQASSRLPAGAAGPIIIAMDPRTELLTAIVRAWDDKMPSARGPLARADFLDLPVTLAPLIRRARRLIAHPPIEIPRE